jgi:hypothetical protein
MAMQRNEGQFCRDESARLLKLSQESTNPKLRAELLSMANEWLERARAKEAVPKSA